MKYLLLVTFLIQMNVFGQIHLNKPFCEKKLIGYVTSWSSTNQSIDYSQLTHAFFSFLKPSLEGGLIEFNSDEESNLEEYLSKTKKHNCKRFISLGGGGDPIFPVMATNPTARKLFIANVIEFCKSNGFQGIDMDWEAMDTEEKKKNYTSLMKEFRVALTNEKLEFTATIGFGDYWCKWIEDEALKQTDWIQLMIYDATGTWNESPYGNHASFEHYLEAIEYWTKRGFEKNKIVLGLPFYGYRFSSKNGGLGVYSSYSSIINGFPNISSTENETPNDDMCFFNGIDMIKKKTSYALNNGFAGVMVWEMSQDCQGDKSLHKAIMDEFKLYCK